MGKLLVLTLLKCFYSHVNTESEDETGVNVLIDSFSGRTIRIRVAKKKGKEKENLLNEGKSEEENEDHHSVWRSISLTYVVLKFKIFSNFSRYWNFLGIIFLIVC